MSDVFTSNVQTLMTPQMTPQITLMTSQTNEWYRPFIIKLAQECKSEDIQHMKYILKETIPAGKMEKISSPLDLFSYLEHRDIIGPQRLEPLCKLFEDIDRPHLIKMIDEFDDSYSTFPLKPKSENHLEKNGYALSIKGGRHFETSEGEFVEVQSGSNYALTLINKNNHRCECMIRIDDRDIFPSGFGLYPGYTTTLERPESGKQKFIFFAITDAPEGSGINRWRRNHNGLVKVIFTPEKADMKITCTATGHTAKDLTCSDQITDSDFHKMVSKAFAVSKGMKVIIMVNNCKPLGKRNLKVTEYGIQDGSRVTVNLGGKGGTKFPRRKSRPASKKDRNWKAGATALEDESGQRIGYANAFPVESGLAVTLYLRLVARSGERALPSRGKCTPLATICPPPVPV